MQVYAVLKGYPMLGQKGLKLGGVVGSYVATTWTSTPRHRPYTWTADELARTVSRDYVWTSNSERSRG